MTSPAIKSSEKSRKALRQSSTGSQETSATHSGSITTTATESYNVIGLFSWLKVFRFANLLMRQGC